MTSPWNDPFLTRQVEVLSSPDARVALRALKVIWGFDGDEPARPPDPAPASPDQGLVGIWKRTREADGRTSYVRAAEAAAEWGVWADVHRIAAKSASRRVVLLGESVARGFLFDPGFTVAQGLRSVLDRAAGERAIEVVDLACAGLPMAGLVSVARATPALQPDVVVVFGGNNWRNAVNARQSAARRCALAGALLDGGIPGLQRQCHSELRDDAGEALRQIAAVFAPLNIPVVLVIPDFNLSDWRERDARPAWLPDGRNAEWLALKRRAEAARETGDGAAGDALAEQMLQIDGGTCPETCYLLADSRQRRGERQDARRLLERARDATVWDPSPLLSPRVFGVIQDTMRTEGARLGMHVVDLPRAFDAYLPDGVPDRRLFLDYCHLTAEGIRVAVAAIAATLLPLTGRRGVRHDTLLAVPVAMRSGVEAVGHFGAAIHNAHWGQPRALVDYHCARAARLHPDIARLMEDYLELGARPAPAWMCSALERMSGRDDIALVRYILSALPLQPKLLDRDLLGAVAATVGDGAERRLESRWCDEYGTPGVTTTLHQPCFAIRSLGQREAFNLVHTPAEWPSFFRAYSPASSFALIADQSRPIELHLTARAPEECAAGGEVSVTVNGSPVLTDSMGNRWKTWRIAVPAACIRRGINDVAVRWPEPHWETSAGLSRAIDAIQLGTTPELFPAFGEIHAFRARND